MRELITYIENCIKPRDETEFVICEQFDIDKFNNLRQDGIMVTKTKASDINNMECIKVDDYYFIKKIFKSVEWLNNDGTIQFTDSSDPIYRRLLPPPWETVNHTFIMSCIITYMNKNERKGSYIEYGVAAGNNHNSIARLVEKTYAVDISEPPRLESNCAFYKSYTDDFSLNELPNIKFQYAFIDADHKYESSFKDFEAIYRHIDNGGFIFMHDTYPCSREFLDPWNCNDSYKTPIAIKRAYPDIEILTLPLNPGLTIIRKA
jgi:hypothetical protein